MIRRIVEKIYYGVRYFGMRVAGFEWLFVLGHMRSGSSLLVHLLNSNPEVLGYGETPIRYAGRRSLVELHDNIRSQFEAHGERQGWEYRYIMDKILWPHIRSQRVLCRAPLSLIVIVRDPSAALPSILALDIEAIQTSEEALSYYQERLKRLRDILVAYDSPFVCTTYSELTKRTETTLQGISEYLALDEKLTPTYDTIWATGKSGIGDPSNQIESGEVRSDQKSYKVDVDPGIIQQAEETYRQFRSFCASYGALND